MAGLVFELVGSDRLAGFVNLLEYLTNQRHAFSVEEFLIAFAEHLLARSVEHAAVGVIYKQELPVQIDLAVTVFNGIEDRSIFGALAHRVFQAPVFAQIAHEGDQAMGISAAHGCDCQLGGKLAAIAMNAANRNRFGEEVFVSRREKLLKVGFVGVAPSLWNDDMSRLPDGFRARPTKCAFGARIPVADDSCGIHLDECVKSDVKHRSHTVLGDG